MTTEEQIKHIAKYLEANKKHVDGLFLDVCDVLYKVEDKLRFQSRCIDALLAGVSGLLIYLILSL